MPTAIGKATILTESQFREFVDERPFVRDQRQNGADGQPLDMLLRADHGDGYVIASGTSKNLTFTPAARSDLNAMYTMYGMPLDVPVKEGKAIGLPGNMAPGAEFTLFQSNKAAHIEQTPRCLVIMDHFAVCEAPIPVKTDLFRTIDGSVAATEKACNKVLDDGTRLQGYHDERTSGVDNRSLTSVRVLPSDCDFCNDLPRFTRIGVMNCYDMQMAARNDAVRDYLPAGATITHGNVADGRPEEYERGSYVRVPPDVLQKIRPMITLHMEADSHIPNGTIVRLEPLNDEIRKPPYDFVVFGHNDVVLMNPPVELTRVRKDYENNIDVVRSQLSQFADEFNQLHYKADFYTQAEYRAVCNAEHDAAHFVTAGYRGSTFGKEESPCNLITTTHHTSDLDGFKAIRVSTETDFDLMPEFMKNIPINQCCMPDGGKCKQGITQWENSPDYDKLIRNGFSSENQYVRFTLIATDARYNVGDTLSITHEGKKDDFYCVTPYAAVSVEAFKINTNEYRPFDEVKSSPAQLAAREMLYYAGEIDHASTTISVRPNELTSDSVEHQHTAQANANSDLSV